MFFFFLHWKFITCAFRILGCVNEHCKQCNLLKQIEKSLYLTSANFPMIASLSPSPQGGSTWFVDEWRSAAVTLLLESRSLIPRFTACPKQMGDSGNWHQGLQHAVVALSPEIPHLYLSSVKVSTNAAKVKPPPPPPQPLPPLLVRNTSTEGHSVSGFQRFIETCTAELELFHFQFAPHCFLNTTFGFICFGLAAI